MTQALLQMLAAGGGASLPTYVDDVFGSYLYAGNDSTQTITNGINLSTNGGMVWTKNRSSTLDHVLIDNSRTVSKALSTNLIVAENNQPGGVTGFTSSGYTLGSSINFNGAGLTYVSWTFRKAARFFDVVTGTTNGSGNIALSHSLGVTPGMVILKSTAASGSWIVYHTSLGTNPYLVINESGAAASAGLFSGVTTTSFSVTNPFGLQNSAYVAYLFAHDTGADGLIQCGSFTTDGSGGATVNHGWSAGVQFALVKCSSTTGDWEMYDTARTSGWSGSDARLRANLSNAEDSVTRLSASGTSVTFAGLSNSATYIYMFIKAP